MKRIASTILGWAVTLFIIWFLAVGAMGIVNGTASDCYSMGMKEYGSDC